MRTKTIRLTQMFGLLVCFLVMAVGNSQAIIIIDNFDDPVGDITVEIENPGSVPTDAFGEVSGLSTSDTIGGVRALKVHMDVNHTDMSIETSSTLGKFLYETGNSAEGTGHVQWDGTADGYATRSLNLGGIDITEGGKNQYFVMLTDYDKGYATDTALVLTVYANDTTSDSSNKNLGGVNFKDKLIYFPFSDFAGTDLTKVGAIELDIIPNGDATDLAIDFFAADIPEPGTLILLGSGLLGLAGYVKRRKKKTA